MLRLAVICGGPSPERGISLNSARSVMDHLASEEIEIVPIYVDLNLNFYSISCSQLYSNTPSDFDFKLAQTASKLDFDRLKSLLKSVDLAFPVIHGPFGEDGQLQALLEKLEVPFIGSSSVSCAQFFHKSHAAALLKKQGFPVLPSLLLQEGFDNSQIDHFFQTHRLKKAIIKPAIGGSSIGVSIVHTSQEALQKYKELSDQGIYREAILEPFCEGVEFTILVLETLDKKPVALLPTEIEKAGQFSEIFDYRKKYLPTNQVAYHTPPRFDFQIVQEIRQQAEKIFALFNMRDFVRIDGWLLPDNTLLFTDFNPISGLEQNSFFFRQASVLGLTHREVLDHLVRGACERNGLEFPRQKENLAGKSPVFVLFGGTNAERQVSLMSGTNVWLKLRRSRHFSPIPFLFDFHGAIWELPYSYALNHTVEEIYHNCETSEEKSSSILRLIEMIQDKLQIPRNEGQNPRKMNLDQFIAEAQEKEAFVFIAMHGGIGEDGTLQAVFEKSGIKYNGSNATASALCMDKYATGNVINQAGEPTLAAVPKKILNSDVLKDYGTADSIQFWNALVSEFNSEALVVKPRCDGCSAGIVLLKSAQDLERYIFYVREKCTSIPAGAFPNQKGIIEMPASVQDFIVEPYIETDRILIEQSAIKHIPNKGWIELTVGVLEENGIYRAFNPSITVAEGAVLSLEEKFQGGTGVNLTPPPETIVTCSATQKIKKQVEKAAQSLGIRNYCRIDIFFNLRTEQVIVIEANTLPGLTPSTVIYHQGLAEKEPLSPTSLLEKIIMINNKLTEISAEQQLLLKKPLRH